MLGAQGLGEGCGLPFASSSSTPPSPGVEVGEVLEPLWAP